MQSVLKHRPNDVEAQSPSTLSSSYSFDEKISMSSTCTARDDTQDSYADIQQSPPPVRKYSKEWWKNSWNAAVAEGRWPRFIYALMGMLLLCVWFSTTVYFAQDDINWIYRSRQAFSEQVNRGVAANVGGEHADLKTIISLSGSLKQFDQNARKLSVEWKGLWQQNKTSAFQPLGEGTYPNFPFPLKIYRDVSTVLFDYRNEQSNTTTSTRSAYLDYRLDNGSMPHIGVIGAHKFDSISTEIVFSQDTDEPTATSQPQFSYPFDVWKGDMVLVARWASTAYTATAQGNYTNTDVVALDGARLEDNSLNWRFSLNFYNPCPRRPDDIKEYLKKYSDPANPDVWSLDDMTDAEFQQYPVPCHLEITMNATRPPLVQFAAITAVIVNWTSTIFIFILTCECLIMRRGYTMAGSDLLAVTFTALFALPSVRMLLPGAPDFGCLNLVGIIPQVIIVSLCITAIAITKLRKDGRDRKKEY